MRERLTPGHGRHTISNQGCLDVISKLLKSSAFRHISVLLHMLRLPHKKWLGLKPGCVLEPVHARIRGQQPGKQLVFFTSQAGASPCPDVRVSASCPSSGDTLLQIRDARMSPSASGAMMLLFKQFIPRREDRCWWQVASCW